MEIWNELLLWKFWPLWIATALLIFAAILNHLTKKVHNSFTFATCFAGFAVALSSSLGLAFDELDGGLFSCIVSMLFVSLLVITAWLFGIYPGGPVKMQVAFAAWLSCAFEPMQAAGICSLSTLAGIVVTVIAQLIAASILIAVSRFRSVPKEELQKSVQFPTQLFATVGTLAGLVAYLLIWPA